MAFRILVVGSSASVTSTLRRQLEREDFAVAVADAAESALQEARTSAPDLICASAESSAGEQLCRDLKVAAPSSALVAYFPPDADDADRRAAAVGADSCLVAPLKRGNVLSCVAGALRIRDLERQIADLESRLDQRANAPAPAAPERLEFDFFKRLMLMEVKRSRRYSYPLAFLLVAVDRYSEVIERIAPPNRAHAMGQLLAAVAKGVRDVDLCVAYAEDKFLVFLPHTHGTGALTVAGRLHNRISKEELEGLDVKYSIGVAAYDGHGTVSFGRLLKEASAALKRAQAAGGDRVEASGIARVRERVTLV